MFPMGPRSSAVTTATTPGRASAVLARIAPRRACRRGERRARARPSGRSIVKHEEPRPALPEVEEAGGVGAEDCRLRVRTEAGLVDDAEGFGVAEPEGMIAAEEDAVGAHHLHQVGEGGREL